MAARNDESYLFIVEWFDPMPQLKKQYILKYFYDQHMVEMIDVKSKRTFLKKSPCPEEITTEDFVLGGKVLLYSRELEIVDYGDRKTREKLHFQKQYSMILMTSEEYSYWGKMVTEILKDTNLTLYKIKTVNLPANMADTVCNILGENLRMTSKFSAGTLFAMVVFGDDGFDRVKAASNATSAKYGNFFYSKNGVQTNELTDLLMDGTSGKNLPNSATLDSCTCCIVKPHAVKRKLVGPIMDMIISQGYEISAARTLLFEKVQAQEFLEVYDGVISEYKDQVIQLCLGMCVAFEVRAEMAVETFRETAGPWDVELAKELRPETIRGMFGEDKVRSAVHCSDLATDGVLECEYCFKML